MLTLKHYVIAELIFIFIIFTCLNSCNHGDRVVLRFSNPPNSDLWQRDFVIWKVPVAVFSTYRDGSYVMGDTKKAIVAWNSLVGCEVFFSSTSSSSEVVVTDLSKPTYSGKVAGTAKLVHRTVNGYVDHWGADINVMISYKSALIRENLLMHEFGHVLGLKDLDYDPGLIMHKVVSDGAEVQTSVLRELNSLYCQ